MTLYELKCIYNLYKLLSKIIPIHFFEFDPQIVGPLVLSVPEDACRGTIMIETCPLSPSMAISGGDSRFTIDPVRGINPI